MASFNNSPQLFYTLIHERVHKVFEVSTNSSYHLNKKWLKRLIDTHLYTFYIKLIALEPNIDIDDETIIKEYIESIVFQVCNKIESSISSTHGCKD